LEEQLRQHLSASPAGDVALWWVARLAMAGGCAGLAPELAEHAKDRSRPAAARRVLVRAVAYLDADGASLRALAEIPAPTPEEDPDCELAGELIDRLYPDTLTVSRLLPLLGRAPATAHLYGGYMRALERLPQRVPVHDLPAALGWLAGIPENFGWLSPTDELYTGLVERAWQHIDDEPVLDALADLLIGADHSQRWGLHQHAKDTPPWTGGDPYRRRMLLLAVAGRLTEQSRYKILELQLLEPDDAPWLLDVLPTLPPATAETIALCLQPFASRLSPQTAARVRTLEPGHPAAALAEHLPTAPDGPPAAPALSRRAEPESDDPDRAERVDQLLEALSTALDDARRDVNSWWNVPKLLSYDQDARVANRVPNHDMTQLPGWGLLTDAEQRDLIERGIEYLETHVPATDTVPGGPVSREAVLPDLAGVHLLATLLLNVPAKLADVPEPVWVRWAPVIVTGLESHQPDDADIRGRLIASLPAAARRAAAATALTHLDRMIEAGRYMLPTALEALIPDIAPQVASLLTGPRCRRPLAAQLLELLVRQDAATALDACRTLAQRPGTDPYTQARDLRARHDPRRVLDELVATGPALAEHAEMLEHLSLDGLDQPRLASLAGLLLDAYPPADDPNALPEEPDHNDGLRRLRDSVLNQLVERAMPAALTRLRTGRASGESAMLLRAARQREIDLSAPDISPEALMKLLAHGDHRLVRSDTDLVHVVLEALDHLQHAITARAAWRYVWDGTEQPKGEDAISDWIRNELGLYFGRHVMIDRECQVARYKERGSGTRIDLTFTAPTAGRPAGSARVIAEAKRIDNGQVGTSLLNQLDRRYLVPERLSHGIYLTYWVDPAQLTGPWTKKYPSAETLESILTEQATRSCPLLWCNGSCCGCAPERAGWRVASAPCR
jgi:hypothetical protein